MERLPNIINNMRLNYLNMSILKLKQQVYFGI